MSGTEAIAEVFATAFRALPDSEKEVVIERLLREEKPREPVRPPRKDAIQELMEHPLVFAGSRPPSRDEMHDGR
ncbi:MAG: hypothetical protein ACHQNE_05080 [Candidatus Kapaibacterium sp.]